MKIPRLALAILTMLTLLALAAAGPLAAQPESEIQGQTGDLVCNVIDGTGKALAGVSVTVTGMGAPQVQLSNAEGLVRFLGLAPGNYKLEAKLEGFGTVEYPAVAVMSGRSTEIEIAMNPAKPGA